jgi:ankyrin repeat protein
VHAKAAGDVTPLMLSLDMAFGQPESAMALIRAGADVNVADINGDTALIIAATESSNEVFQVLSGKGCKP